MQWNCMCPKTSCFIYAQLKFYCDDAFFRVLGHLEYDWNESLLDDFFSIIYDVKLRFFIPLQLSQIAENDSNSACGSRLDA